ncbi:MAG: NADAR family protein [Phycisphaerales bacterium]
MREIQFQRHGAGHAAFSTTSPHSVHIDGEHWPTVEHYVQAHRFLASDIQRQDIQAATCGSEVQRIVVCSQAETRPDWTDVRDGLMYRGLMAKCRQHPGVRDALLATGSCLLSLRRHGDRYWGDGGDGSGQNMVGRTLMAIREELRRESGVAVTPR